MAKPINDLFYETMERLLPSVLVGVNGPYTPSRKILNALRADQDLADRFVETLLSNGNLEIPENCKNEILDLVIHHPFTDFKLTADSLIAGLKEGHLFIGECNLPRVSELPEWGTVTAKCQITYPDPFQHQGLSIIYMIRTVDDQEKDEFYIPITREEAVRISGGCSLLVE